MFIQFRFFSVISFIAFVLSYLLPASAQAQVATAKACFTVAQRMGCAPFTVRPVDCSGADPSLVFYDFGAGNGPQPAKEFIYTRPGRYAITQFINTGGDGGERTDGQFFIEVFEPVSPVFTTAICRDRRVELRINDNRYPEYEVDMGDGTLRVVEANGTYQHQYANETPHQITVRGYLGGTLRCGEASRSITPQTNLARIPINEIRVLPDGRPTLRFNLQNGATYVLQERNASNPSGGLANTALSNQSSFTGATQVSVFDRPAFRINTIDPCTGRESFNPQELGTFNLQLLPMEGRNQLRWNLPDHTGFVSYTLFRNGEVYRVFNSASQNTFTDTDLRCATRYCYRLEVAFYDNTARSISAEQCMSTNRDSNPQPLQALLANVQNNTVTLNWKLPPNEKPATILMYRSVNGGPEQEISIPAQAPYADQTAAIELNHYCYRFTYVDACGNKAPLSAAVCPVRLQLSSTDAYVLLQWNAAGLNGITYYIEELDAQGSRLGLSQAIGNFTLRRPLQELQRQVSYFRVYMEVNSAEYGRVALFSNIVRFRVPAQLDFPTAFSPNGDGLNDTFKVMARFVNAYELQVYNTWGELVYISRSTDDVWDGSFRDKPLPAGGYVYTIEARDTEGRPVRRRGMLMIVK
jgi:gliding motility-associated-like protein